MHMVGYRSLKSSVCVKRKSKIAHNFFLTKSYNYIFKKPLNNGCRNMCHTLIFVLNKKKIFLNFLAFFPTLPSTQTIKVIDLIFFSMSWP